MVKIGLDSFQNPELLDASINQPIKEDDLQILITSFSSNPRDRTLKAVYPHFANCKRHANEQMHFPSQNLSHDELKSAMEEATKDYGAMQDIQKQLNRIYQELMSKSY